MIDVMQSTESSNKKLSCRRQTARRICANTMAPENMSKHDFDFTHRKVGKP